MAKFVIINSAKAWTGGDDKGARLKWPLRGPVKARVKTMQKRG